MLLVEHCDEPLKKTARSAHGLMQGRVDDEDVEVAVGPMSDERHLIGGILPEGFQRRLIQLTTDNCWQRYSYGDK